LVPFILASVNHRQNGTETLVLNHLSGATRGCLSSTV